jgi:hypothetical protein
MTWDYATENRRMLAENERSQEAWRLEQIEREKLDLQKRQTLAIERQANRHSDIVGLLFLGLILAAIVGAVWLVLLGLLWVVRVLWRILARRPNTPHDPEQDLMDILRENNVDPDVVRQAVEETLRRTRRP